MRPYGASSAPLHDPYIYRSAPRNDAESRGRITMRPYMWFTGAHRYRHPLCPSVSSAVEPTGVFLTAEDAEVRRGFLDAILCAPLCPLRLMWCTTDTPHPRTTTTSRPPGVVAGTALVRSAISG